MSEETLNTEFGLRGSVPAYTSAQSGTPSPSESRFGSEARETCRLTRSTTPRSLPLNENALVFGDTITALVPSTNAKRVYEIGVPAGLSARVFGVFVSVVPESERASNGTRAM